MGFQSIFCSKVDMLCLQDRWGFLWEDSHNSGGVSICVEGSGGLGAMEKGESALVTKMGMCY